MPSIETRLKDDVKAAMKSGAKDDLEVLRMLLSDVKNVAIQEGQAREGFDDALVVRVLRKGVKTRTESATMYAAAGRKDLEQKELFQIGVLERYLPKSLGEAELEALVQAVIQEQGATSKKAMGAVIKAVMERVDGRADGKAVSAVVGRKLP